MNMLPLALCVCFVSSSATAVEVASGRSESGSGSMTKFPEGMFGAWYPKEKVTPKSILGPLSFEFLAWHEGGFSALRDHETGDVWFTLLMGQVFRVRGNQMQYCFGEVLLMEQSPFSVDSTNENNVTFCWRTGLRGMPTHRTGCSGCDCAKILINLVDENTLTFQFWMSPPVLHADIVLTRKGPEPPFMKAIWPLMPFPYQQCAFRDHYGPNLPGEPNLRNKTNNVKPITGGGCARSALSDRIKNNPDIAALLDNASRNVGTNSAGHCHQLNGLNYMLNSVAKRLQPSHAMDVSDVKIQYKTPSFPCDPCDVSYSVSAKIEEDEYIGVSFKGQSWEGKYPYPPEREERPCYFGMCVDSYDNFTSDRIALGYTSGGGCVREMVSKDVIGAPVDVDHKILSKTSVARVGDRTILRFTVSQHWPKFNTFDGIRVMWAIGKVSDSNGCVADIGYHGVHRGVSPIDWLFVLGSTPCRYNPLEMDDSIVAI